MVPDHDKTMVDESVLSVPEDNKTMEDKSVTLGKNQAIVILKDIRIIPAESNFDSNNNQIAAPKNKIKNGKIFPVISRLFIKVLFNNFQ